MNFIFSEEDKEIIGSMRYVDPLGIQPIWHFYARRIVPNLTEQTSTIQGFVLFVYVINLYNDFILNSNKVKEISLISFFLIIEKLLGISICTVDKTTWKLRGIEGIDIFLNGTETSITQEIAILLNQKANGTWGLYRGAVIRSKIMDDDNILQNGFNSIGIKDKDEVIDFLRKKIQMDNNIITYSIGIEECDTLRDSFLDMFDKESNSEFLKNVFEFILRKPENCFTNFMMELPLKDLNTVQEYFTLETKDFKDNEKLNDIIKVENYLSYLSNSFYYILDNIDNESFDIEIFKKVLFNYKNEVDKLREISIKTSAGTRLEIYDKNLTNPNFTFMTALIEIHKDVVKSRNKEPWLEIENTKLKLKISRSRNSNGKLDNKWVNSYYINSLMSLRKEMQDYGIQ